MYMPEDNKAIVRRFFEEVVNQGDLQVVDEIFASQVILHDPFFDDPSQGAPEDVKNIVEKIRTAFSDVHVNIEDQMAAETDSVVTRWTGTGTCEGAIESIQPSHVRVELHGMSVSRLSAGKINETWNVMVDVLEHAEVLDQVPQKHRCNWFCHMCPRCCK